MQESQDAASSTPPPNFKDTKGSWGHNLWEIAVVPQHSEFRLRAAGLVDCLCGKNRILFLFGCVGPVALVKEVTLKLWRPQARQPCPPPPPHFSATLSADGSSSSWVWSAPSFLRRSVLIQFINYWPTLPGSTPGHKLQMAARVK